MLEGGKIDAWQAVFLNVIMVIATALLSAPAIMAAQAGQDGWLSALLTTMLGLPIAWITVKLSSLYPGQTLIQYLEDILGQWPGKVLGFLYLLYFIHITSLMAREYGSFLVDVFLIGTPITVVNAIGLIISAYIIKLGLEVLARSNQLFFPWVIGSLVLTFLLVIPEMDLARVQPVLEAGGLQIFKGSLAPLAWYGEIIAFAMVIPFLAKPGEAGKIVILTFIILGLIFFLLVVVGLAVFGPGLPNMNYPILNVTRVISLSRVIERPEPLIMTVWVTGGLFKVTFFYYIIVLGSAQLLQLKSYRPLVLPVGAILAALSLNVSASTLQMFSFIAHYWPFYALFTFEFGFPVALLGIALIKNRGNKSK
ncbi:MAG: endospore germination permease [Desulfotomaculaceae bacterium]